MQKTIKSLALTLTLSTALVGCAGKNRNPQDPYEGFNRGVYTFNRKVDIFVIKPFASTYRKLVPWYLQKGFSNFYSNLDQVPTVINDLLQLKFMHAGRDTWRFLINSSMGLGGFFDVAQYMSMPNHHEDFGMTLAAWGDKHSPFIVLPLLGPSTIRDAFGDLYNNAVFSIWPIFAPACLSIPIGVHRVLHKRAELLDAEKVIAHAAFDRYSFERDAYLQHRNALIRKNNGIVEEDPYLEE